MIAAAGLSAIVVTLGGKILTVLLIAAIGGIGLIFVPLPFLLAVLIGLTFLVVGPAGYIPKLTKVQWAPYMIAMILALRMPVEWLRVHRELHGAAGKRQESPLPAFVYLLLLFLGIAVLSTAVNDPGPMEVLVGAKLYLFMWSALFLIGTSTLSPGALERIWKALLWIAVLQLPVALLQRVFIVPRREAGATRLDSVVGTFSGNIAGGGSSGALALFLVVALVLAAALWRRGLLRGGAFFALAACAFFTIALAEVKVVIVLLPLAFILLFFKELRTRPAVFAGIALACTLLVGAVLAVYQWQAWGTGQFGAQRTLSQNLQASLGYVLDPNNINRYTGEVGRVAALNLWWKHPHRTVFDVLFGYGMASCHASTVSLGALAKQYLPLNLPANTLAALLWDTGALGALAFCAVLGFGALSAIGCLRARQLPPFHGAALETSAVGLVLIGVTLAYNRDMLYTPSIQLLLMLMLGQVLYWRIRRPRRTA